jgi:TonB-linked SusC/RagA family outer membrane protein
MQTVTNQLFSSMFSTPSAEGRARQTRWLLGRMGLLLAAFVLVGAVLVVPASAQHTVTGEVVDAREGTTLPGVNIVVQGTQTGTTTRSDGSFTVEAPADDATLVFSFVGYQQQEVPIEGRSEITVQLEPAVTAMEEVVVNVGYQEQTIETTTGSVSQVSGEDLDIQPTTNLTQTLQGTIPGLIGVNSSGRPGRDNSNLLIRGASTLNNNSPLVVIDGVPGRQGGLARLDPADIQSVSVLKDASAAIYGSRAANGVILVETKEGRAGETQIDVNVEQSYAQPTVVPDMANAMTYMQMMNEQAGYNNQSPFFTQEEMDQTRQLMASGEIGNSYEFHNTDWYGTALQDFSQETTASASITGGGETVQYRTSINAATEDGILVNSGTGFDQLGFRSNLQGDVTDNFNMNLNLHGRVEERSIPAWTRGLNSAWEMLQRGKPTEPAFFPNGKPGPAQENGVNPVVANQTGFDDETTYFFQSDLNMTYDVPAVEGWSIEGTVAYDRHFYNEKRWQKPWTLYSFTGMENGEPVLQGSEVGVPEPRLTENDRDMQDILLRATTTYDKSLGDHNTSFLLGTEFQSSDMDTTHTFRRFFPTDQIQEFVAGGTSQQNIFGTGEQSARFNFFGRLNYNYSEKYLVEVVARYDGSYIFPEGERFGFFPSISAGWRIAQEDWFNGVTNGVFDRLKLRSSFGLTGNDQIEPYQFLRTYALSGQTAFGDGLGTTISQTRVPNPAVTWEVARQFDVGLEGAVLDSRLSFNLTYFNHFRDDILWFRSEAIPSTAGFSLPRENIGQVRSTGYEAQVNYTQDVTSNFSFRVGANMTFAEDEIVDFAEADGVPAWQENEGRPMGTGLFYVDDGIWNTQEEINQAEANCPNGNLCHWPGARPGDVRFKDINGDGVINADDRRRVTENGRPDLIGGLNLGATYGNFNLNLQLQGAAQVRHYVFTGAAGTFGNYFQAFAEDRWTSENTDASGPRAYQRTNPYWASNQNTFFLRDAKYLRLKAAQLSYQVPQSLTQGIGVGSFQVYLSGRNLLTLTPIEVVDPEIRNDAGQVYPPERAYTFGVRMGL